MCTIKICWAAIQAKCGLQAHHGTGSTFQTELWKSKLHKVLYNVQVTITYFSSMVAVLIVINIHCYEMKYFHQRYRKVIITCTCTLKELVSHNLVKDTQYRATFIIQSWCQFSTAFKPIQLSFFHTHSLFFSGFTNSEVVEFIRESDCLCLHDWYEWIALLHSHLYKCRSKCLKLIKSWYTNPGQCLFAGLDHWTGLLDHLWHIRMHTSAHVSSSPMCT